MLPRSLTMCSKSTLETAELCTESIQIEKNKKSPEDH